jgi:intracellular multiplication protein IcmC
MKRLRLFFGVIFTAFFPVISYAQLGALGPPPVVNPAAAATQAAQQQAAQAAANSSTQPGLDALNMMINLSKSYPALWEMVTGLCYVMGMILVLRAVYYLKVYGELRTMTATSSSLKIPITYFVAGCVFLFIPTAFQTLQMTTFGTTSVLRYDQVNTSINPIVLKAVGGFVELLGLVSFVRGWMMLVAQAQGSGGQHGSFGKALTHIIGGFLLLNIYGLVTLIWNTFGLTFTL